MKKIFTLPLVIALVALSVSVVFGQELQQDIVVDQASTTDKVIDPFDLISTAVNDDERIFLKSVEYEKLSADVVIDDSVSFEYSAPQRIDGGVELWVSAENAFGSPIAFGDGSVEFEHLRIINPPVLVEDGTVIQDTILVGGIEVPHESYGFKYDPKAALEKVIKDTISLVGQAPYYLVPGKVGHTTTVVYPAAGTGGVTMDGINEFEATSWANARAHTGTDHLYNTSANEALVISEYCTACGNKYYASHAMFTFDTSVIGSTSTIDSATFSVYGDGTKDSTEATYPANLALVAYNSSSSNSFVAGDYLNFGTTRLADTDLLVTAFGSAGYKDMTLNATGLALISTTSTTKLGIRGANDFSNATAPTARSYAIGYYADQAGTANDPKLTIVSHVTAATSTASSTSTIVINRSSTGYLWAVVLLILVGLLVWIFHH